MPPVRMPRAKRRLGLELGATRAFTKDLSPGGFCVELVRPLPPGSSVRGALQVGAERFDFTGQVAWARQGDPRLAVRAQVGVRFTGIAAGFFALLASLLPSPV